MKPYLQGAMALLSFGVCLYAAGVYLLLPLGALLHPDMKAAFMTHAFAIRLHIFSSIVALAVGPLQFRAALRQRQPRLHRALGRVYLGVGVVVGGLSGLYVAQFAFGGAAARIGFTLLAIAWLYTGWMAYAAIRRGDVAAHRGWMVRNFALTFAAVMLRLYLPVAMAAGAPFESACALIAWACWVPNLVIACLWTTPRRPWATGAATS